MIEYFYFENTFYIEIATIQPLSLCRENDSSLSVIR